MQGVVKKYFGDRGFAFISVDGEDDVFCHVSDIARSGLDTLTIGQRVEFDVAAGKKGPKAVNLKVID